MLPLVSLGSTWKIGFRSEPLGNWFSGHVTNPWGYGSPVETPGRFQWNVFFWRWTWPENRFQFQISKSTEIISLSGQRLSLWQSRKSRARSTSHSILHSQNMLQTRVLLMPSACGPAMTTVTPTMAPTGNTYIFAAVPHIRQGVQISMNLAVASHLLEILRGWRLLIWLKTLPSCFALL